MGNCFKTPSTDDITLLHDNDSQDGTQQAAPVPVGPPPPYQVNISHFIVIMRNVREPTKHLFFSNTRI